MDEKALRAHFERAARASLPPSTVDVDLARKVGRRRLRIRLAGIPASSFAVAIVAGALFAGGVLPIGGSSRPTTNIHAHKNHAGKPKHVRGPIAPASFDPLSIYASFGWLPPGFTVTNPPYPQSSTQSFAEVEGPRSFLALTVYAARQCSVTGPIWSPRRGTFQFTDGGKHRRYLHSRRYAHGLQCESTAQANPNPLIPAGHLANGHPAYLMVEGRGYPTALAWQYARGGWAVIEWQGRKPVQLRELAARVRFRSNLRLRFPFRLTGIPASWKVSGAGSQVEANTLLGYALYLDPGDGTQGITILIEPPYTNGCVNIGGTTQPATFDGAAGVTRSAGQEACFGSLHGLYVYVRSDQPGGAIGLLHHLQVLGPDPANWTTKPLG